MSNIKIGIIGLGFVGGAILKSFENKNIKNINIYDKYKNGGIGNIKDIFKSDILFLALPTIFKEDLKQYDKQPIVETCQILNDLKFKGIIVIKSTVEPETINILSNNFEYLQFIHNPEFLTARTAYQDFHNQKHIVLGKCPRCSLNNLNIVKNFYKKYYPEADISLCSSTESETMKLFCNSFYAMKVQIFTEFNQLCEKNNTNFNKIKNMMLKNNWINEMHTNVPGPDGKISYGGLCFPKDTNALNNYMIKKKSINNVLNASIKERNEIRDDNNNCIFKKNQVIDI